MGRGKSITKLLLDSSQAALYAGVEIHNKPHIAYRYPTSAILIVNAWELALKAYVYKYIGKSRIYKQDGKHTIDFSKALCLTRDDINKNGAGQEYKAVFDNVDLLNEYRCSNVHYVEPELNPIIFTLISKAVLNYDKFLKDFFKKDITKDDNLIILPVGFKLPFNPIEYLIQDYGNASNDFVNRVIETIRNLDNAKIQDSVVIGFEVYTSSVKKIRNADIIAAIDKNSAQVTLHKGVRFTDDPKAPLVRIENQRALPLTYQNVRDRVKEKRPDILFNNRFHNAMKIIKADGNICQSNYLDPENKKGPKKDFYSENAVEEVIKKYDELSELGY